MDWLQSMKMIFDRKECNEEKSFKLAILKMKGYVSLLYEHLKKNSPREPKSKMKT